MNNWEKSLAGILGEKGIESLSKAIHRRDSDSTIGPLDVYLPLLVVPRAILSWLVQNVKPIPVGDEKQLKFPGNENIDIRIEKTGRDSYRAEFTQDGKVIHTFEKQTLPNVGGHLMSMGEMYEDFLDPGNEEIGHVHDNPEGGHTGGPETQEEAQAEAILSPDMAMPRTVMGMMAPDLDYGKTKEIQWSAVENLATSVGKLVDALVANKKVEDGVAEVINKAAMKENGRSAEQIAEEKIKDYDELEIRTIKSKIKKTAGQIAAETPSGQVGPSRPDGFIEPEKRSRKQKSTSYFRNKLPRPTTQKHEQEYHMSDAEIYTPCVHCGVPEFQKTESGPKYKPCACFYITLKNEDGHPASFVRLTKKVTGGYALSFGKDAEPDVREAFLATLKACLNDRKDRLD